MKTNYVYYRVGEFPAGLYRFPAAKRSKAEGEFWNGTEWCPGIAKTVKQALWFKAERGVALRKLTQRQAENLIREITAR